jgi:hypothetical protein
MTSRHGLYLAFAVGAASLLFHVYLLDPRILDRSANPIGDDTYITLRYAKHLADGHGLRYNVGGERVEGFTSFLWVVILAAVHHAGCDIVRGAQVLALTCALVTLGIVLRWLSELCRDPSPEGASRGAPPDAALLIVGAVLLHSLGAYAWWSVRRWIRQSSSPCPWRRPTWRSGDLSPDGAPSDGGASWCSPAWPAPRACSSR